MKIYTRTGDRGETSLIGGARVPKYHARVEAYGSVDELIAFIGLLRDQAVSAHHREMLLHIQDRLMICASVLATGPEQQGQTGMHPLPQLAEQDIVLLEKEIDNMQGSLAPLSSFILPGGHSTVSFCHIARTVCRRAERDALKVGMEGEPGVLVIKYLNRLADYLFVLARALSVELGAQETPWIP